VARTMGETKNHLGFWWRNLKGRVYFENKA
jgi:hypothetical protein